MTCERFEMIRREWKQALASQPSFGNDSSLLLWGETIKALEEAWVERDAAIGQRDEAVKELEALHSEEIIVRYPY